MCYVQKDADFCLFECKEHAILFLYFCINHQQNCFCGKSAQVALLIMIECFVTHVIITFISHFRTLFTKGKFLKINEYWSMCTSIKSWMLLTDSSTQVVLLALEVHACLATDDTQFNHLFASLVQDQTLWVTLRCTQKLLLWLQYFFWWKW